MLKNENGIIKAEPYTGIRQISLLGFFVLAFFLSWLGAFPIIISSYITSDSPVWLSGLSSTLAPLQLLMFFGTLIAALIAMSVNYGLSGLKSLGMGLIKFKAPVRVYFLILFGPGIFSYLAILFARMIDPSIHLVTLDASLAFNFAQILFIQLLLNTEEIAWRGYALPQMQLRYSPFKANLYLTLIWAFFHLPLLMMAGGHPGGYSAVIFLLFILPLGMVMGVSFNKLGGSIILIHILHQSINAWGEAFRLFPVLNNGSQLPMVFFVFGAIVIGAWATKSLLLQSK